MRTLFQKRQYEAIADVLASIRPACPDPTAQSPEHQQWATTVRVLANKFAFDNPNFKRSVFCARAAGHN